MSPPNHIDAFQAISKSPKAVAKRLVRKRAGRAWGFFMRTVLP